jgi:hypothetical protein
MSANCDTIANNAEVLEHLRAAGVISDAPANVPDDYVYSNGAVKRDVLAAIQAAGLAEQYGFANQLRTYYNLDVCCRCASFNQPLVPLMDMNFNEWGGVCEPCARVVSLQIGRRWKHHNNL